MIFIWPCYNESWGCKLWPTIKSTVLKIHQDLKTLLQHNFDALKSLFSHKANLRDLIAVTGLVFLLTTSKNNRTPLLYYVKLCASFQSHRWIQTGGTVRKRSIWDKIGEFFCPLWPQNLKDYLEKQQGTSSMLLQALWLISLPSVESKLSYSPETPNLGQNWQFFVLYDLEIWRMTLKNNRAPHICYFKLCTSFHSHLWIQIGVTVQKRPKSATFLSHVTLKFEKRCDRWTDGWKEVFLELLGCS